MLNGGTGDDWLGGGEHDRVDDGRDILTGGGGFDTFNFNFLSGASGK